MPDDRRSHRVAALLDPTTHIGDLDDPATWVICGHPATADDVAMMAGLELRDLADVTDLLELGRSLADATAEPVPPHLARDAVSAFLRGLGA